MFLEWVMSTHALEGARAKRPNQHHGEAICPGTSWKQIFRRARLSSILLLSNTSTNAHPSLTSLPTFLGLVPTSKRNYLLVFLLWCLVLEYMHVRSRFLVAVDVENRYFSLTNKCTYIHVNSSKSAQLDFYSTRLNHWT